MTLRARLAVAFIAILLAPMAVGVAALAGVTPASLAPWRRASVDPRGRAGAQRGAVSGHRPSAGR